MEVQISPINDYDVLEILSTGESYVIGIDEMSITYTQPADTNSLSDNIQLLKVTSRTACSVGKEEVEKKKGFYFDIEIPEGHWSVEDGNELKAIIDDFKERLYHISNFDNK